jgi:protein tyrosine phosphatase
MSSSNSHLTQNMLDKNIYRNEYTNCYPLEDKNKTRFIDKNIKMYINAYMMLWKIIM